MGKNFPTGTDAVHFQRLPAAPSLSPACSRRFPSRPAAGYIRRRQRWRGFPSSSQRAPYHASVCLSTSGVRRCGVGEIGELPAQDQRAIVKSNRLARGRRHHPGSSRMLPRDESYCNMTNNESFLWDVLRDIMLPAHLRWQAFQERHLELMEAVHGNLMTRPCVPARARCTRPRGGDAAMRSLEMEWGTFCCPAAAASVVASYK
jgi:hypothetical protein